MLEYRATLCHWSTPLVKSNYPSMINRSALSAILNIVIACGIFGVALCNVAKCTSDCNIYGTYQILFNNIYLLSIVSLSSYHSNLLKLVNISTLHYQF